MTCIAARLPYAAERSFLSRRQPSPQRRVGLSCVDLTVSVGLHNVPACSECCRKLVEQGCTILCFFGYWWQRTAGVSVHRCRSIASLVSHIPHRATSNMSKSFMQLMVVSEQSCTTEFREFCHKQSLKGLISEYLGCKTPQSWTSGPDLARSAQ